MMRLFEARPDERRWRRATNRARLAACAVALLFVSALPVAARATTIPLDGYFVSMDAMADGRIGVVLTEVFPEDGKTARLTTYDIASGERLDTTLVGFGPIEVRVAGGGLIVVTSEGGPVTVTAYTLDAQAHLERRGRTTLTTSNSSFVSNLAVAERSGQGFILVATDSAPFTDLVAFGLADAGVVGRSPVVNPTSSLGIYEDDRRTTLVYLRQDAADSGSVVALDVANPAAPTEIAAVSIPRNEEFSGYPGPGFAFGRKGRFVFVANQFYDFTAVDLKKRRITDTLAGDERYIRVDAGPSGLLAVYSADSGTTRVDDSITVVDASHPKRLREVGRLGVDNDRQTVAFALTPSKDRLVVANDRDVDVYTFPELVRTKHMPGVLSDETRRVKVLGDTGRALVAVGFQPSAVVSISLGP